MNHRLSGKSVAIYARYSSSLQSEASVEDQIRVCTEFVVREGGTVNEALVFSDRAESGSGTDRPGFQRLLAKTRETPRSVDVIVAEDLSRISRDSADTQILLRDLRFMEIGLVAAADGIDVTEGRNRAAAMLKGFMNEEALNELKYRTLRGLEGRARAGLSTGGALFGYATKPVVAANGQSLGSEVLVFEPDALIVRRIFALYLAGQSAAGIAKLFNAEGIPSPRAKTKYRLRGWVATTIREMLMNRAYVGEWTFKKRRWVKVPGTNKRRYRARPAEEVLAQNFPARRIIDDETWQKAHDRRQAIAARFTGKAKMEGSVMGRRTQYLMSGLLHCAHCDAAMSISGGSTHRYYMCNDNRKRGTCSNCLSVREDIVRTRVLDTVRRRLLLPARLVALRELAVKALRDSVPRDDSAQAEHEQRLARATGRLQRLIGFVADGNDSDTVRASIRELEAEVRSEGAILAALAARKAEPSLVPNVDEVLRRALQLDELLGGDVTEAREHLRRLFAGGRIRLKAQPDGFYVAESSLLPNVLLGPGLSRAGRAPHRQAAPASAPDLEESDVLHRTYRPRATERGREVGSSS